MAQPKLVQVRRYRTLVEGIYSESLTTESTPRCDIWMVVSSSDGRLLKVKSRLLQLMPTPDRPQSVPNTVPTPCIEVLFGIASVSPFDAASR